MGYTNHIAAKLGPELAFQLGRDDPEPPEHRACRERTPEEHDSVVLRLILMKRPACHVCGLHHNDL